MHLGTLSPGVRGGSETDIFVRSKSKKRWSWVFHKLFTYNKIAKSSAQKQLTPGPTRIKCSFALHNADVRITVLVLTDPKRGTWNAYWSQQELVTLHLERSRPRHSSFKTVQIRLVILKRYLLLFFCALIDSQSIQKCIQGSSKYGLDLRKCVF